MNFSVNGGTGDAALSPETVGMWATRTIYFAKMKAVADVGGPFDNKEFQEALWVQAKEQAQTLWADARAEMGDDFRPVDFILALSGRVLAWTRETDGSS